MNLLDWENKQHAELLDWAKRLANLPTPSDPEYCPQTIKEFPLAMEKSEKLRQICRIKIAQIKDEIQKWHDTYLSLIEAETIVLQKGTVNKFPRIVPRYSSEEKRQRELRARLELDASYADFKKELEIWESLRGDWAAHIDRLRRELRILEINYASAGGDGIGI